MEHVASNLADGTETATVSGLGFSQTFSGVHRIYGEGGFGDDTFTIHAGGGVWAAAEIAFGECRQHREPPVRKHYRAAVSPQDACQLARVLAFLPVSLVAVVGWPLGKPPAV